MKRKNILSFNLRLFTTFKIVVFLTVLANCQESDLIDTLDNHIYSVVEEMPVISVCNMLDGTLDKYLCRETQLYSYIFSHKAFKDLDIDLNYRHVTHIVIEKNGSLSHIEHKRSQSDKVNDILDVIFKDMSDEKFFQPGKHKNKYVRVQYIIPIPMKPEYYVTCYPDESKVPFLDSNSLYDYLGARIKLNGKTIKPKDFDKMEDNCFPNIDINEWLWADKDKITIKINCKN